MNFTDRPKRLVLDVADYIGESESDYVLNYELIARDYATTVSLETKAIAYWCELYLAHITDKVKSVTLLDLGCGNGFIVNSVRRTKEKVALDVSLINLLLVKNVNYKVRAMADTLPFYDDSFNVIICSDLLEHVVNPYTVTKEIQRVLKPKGFVIFATPWKQDLSVYTTVHYKAKYNKYKYVHLRSVDEKAVENWFGWMKLVKEVEITDHMKTQELKPYPIRCMLFKGTD